MSTKHLVIGALAIVGAVIIYKKFIKKDVVVTKTTDGTSNATGNHACSCGGRANSPDECCQKCFGKPCNRGVVR